MYTHQPDHTLPALLRARAVQTPEAAAFAVEETPGRWRTVNWRAFFDQAQAVSGRLRRAGVRRGTRLAIIAPVGLEWEIVHHAALAAGAAVLGLDAHDQPQRLREMLDQAGVDALAVADPSLLECASPACRARLKAVLHWGAAAPDADTWPMAWTLREWMQLDLESWRATFRRSPVKRPKYEGFLRNVAVALGNSGDPLAIDTLRAVRGRVSPLVQEHIDWAIDRLTRGQLGQSPST